MKIKKIFKLKNYLNYLKKYKQSNCKISYSQCGEDIIIDFILKEIGIQNPFYVDIGTNDPIKYNNTYLFYKNGSRGICIEPDPIIFNKIKKIRKRDTSFNLGIGAEKENISTADFFIMSSGTLNTFSREEAEKIEKNKSYGNQKIEKIIKIPLTNINNFLIKERIKEIDLISIDTEGYDYDILESINYNITRPKIICVETARCIDSERIEKEKNIKNLLTKNNYFLYADTFINSIFIDKNVYKKEIIY